MTGAASTLPGSEGDAALHEVEGSNDTKKGAPMISEQALYGQMRSNYPLLRQLLPHHGSLDLELVIRETAIAARIHRCETWQDAWNAATGATPNRAGMFEFTATITCPRCHGKKIDMRRGSWCAECMMRGRVTIRIRQTAMFAPTPNIESALVKPSTSQSGLPHAPVTSGSNQHHPKENARMGHRTATAAAVAALLVAFLPPTTATADTPTPPPPPAGGMLDRQPAIVADNDTILVTFDRAQARPAEAAEAAIELPAAQVADASIEKITPITDQIVAVTLNQPISSTEAAQIGDQAEQAAGVKAAEASATMAPAQTNDSYYLYLWGLRAQSGTTFGVDAETAWPISTGAGTIVGVVDTGITAHPDLSGSSTSIVGGNVVPGYDFIGEVTRAGDLDGRDPDPSDPGDPCPAAQDITASWHGTHVAGTIAAIGNNKAGVVGVAPQAKLEPLRALGQCGGTTEDIVAAILWGAGVDVAGTPKNPNPVSVLNLSLGGLGTCPTAMQTAIDQVVAKGVPVVVAAGNSNIGIQFFQPANCKNVIRVVASSFDGTKAPYSNYGTSSAPATVAAPGGSGQDYTTPSWILSTWNLGVTSLGKPDYQLMVGTSMAAPHVSGVIALMKQLNPDLSPARIATILQSSATVMPSCDRDVCGGAVNAPRAIAIVNAPNELAKLSVPTISGTAMIGGQLSAAGSGVPGATYSYQWLRDGTPIDGATAASYTAGDDDENTQLSVTVTASLEGSTASKSSEAVPIAPNAVYSLEVPQISGTAAIGQTLTTTGGGAAPASYTYRWLRDGTPISEATSDSYIPTNADYGKQLTVEVTASLLDRSMSKLSDPVTISGTSVERVAVPVIAGSAAIGQTLSTVGTGAPYASYTYQWRRSGAPIVGATGASYTLTAADFGTQITVQVTASAFGESASKLSAPVPVTGNSVTYLKVPVVSGKTTVGQKLTTVGAGAAYATYTYQWLRSGYPIGGATASSYTLTSGDLWRQISVKVTATLLGSSVSKTSESTGHVSPGQILSQSLPSTSGTYKKGKTLTAKYGSWLPSPSKVTYRWLRNGKSISGATKSSYKLGSSDKGKLISVRVTVSRAGYTSATATSASHRIR